MMVKTISLLQEDVSLIILVQLALHISVQFISMKFLYTISQVHPVTTKDGLVIYMET
ncbi:hypothetical protein SDC9_191792 [bioreactor metagenome]|uniref:Uncharacterized protein n=1 Tax=bioreactor metagenome TaxID=1076179 RepID=A0A645HYV3_9ZZZZ